MTVNDLAKYIGAYFNIEMTESNLRRIKFYCEMYAKTVQPEVIIREVIKIKEVPRIDYQGYEIEGRLSLDQIAEDVCKLNYVDKDQIIRKKKGIGKPVGSRGETVIAKKQFAMIAKQNKYSLKSIAKYLNQDHTTIIYYLKQPA